MTNVNVEVDQESLSAQDQRNAMSSARLAAREIEKGNYRAALKYTAILKSVLTRLHGEQIEAASGACEVE